VFRPSIAASTTGAGPPLLAYSGCPNAGFSTCSYTAGGAAIALSSGAMFLPNPSAFVSTSGAASMHGTFDHSYPLFQSSLFNEYDVGIGFIDDPLLVGATPGSPQVLVAMVSQSLVQPGVGEKLVPIVSRASQTASVGQVWDYYLKGADGNPIATPIPAGPPGSWDSQVCCASIDGRNYPIQIWYSGLGTDTIWRIGHAELGIDGRVIKSPNNPILTEGPSGSADQRGVSDPSVVWDDGANRKFYRMWYVAHDSLDQTSISLAVSLDGIQWMRNPANPVIRAGDVGLRTIANPTVLLGDDGMRMWVEGENASTPGLSIFELRNGGVLPRTN
jgi:hypothetical protein